MAYISIVVSLSAVSLSFCNGAGSIAASSHVHVGSCSHR